MCRVILRGGITDPHTHTHARMLTCVHSPPRMFFLKVAANGCSNSQPDSSIRQSSVLLHKERRRGREEGKKEVKRGKEEGESGEGERERDSINN